MNFLLNTYPMNESSRGVFSCSSFLMFKVKMDVYNLIERARRTGKIEKGTNEVTKSIERGTARFVAYAKDVEPREIVQHLAILCKEKKIPCEEVDSKQKLGMAADLPVPASSIAIIEPGETAQEINSMKVK